MSSCAGLETFRAVIVSLFVFSRSTAESEILQSEGTSASTGTSVSMVADHEYDALRLIFICSLILMSKRLEIVPFFTWPRLPTDTLQSPPFSLSSKPSCHDVSVHPAEHELFLTL
jgi:hypothetical protein